MISARRTLSSAALLLALAVAAPAQGVNRPDPQWPTRQWAGQTIVADRLLVAFEPDAPPAQRAAAHAAANLGARRAVSTNLDMVELAPGADLLSAMEQYNGRAGVRGVGPDVLVDALAPDPDDPHWWLQWALPKVAATDAWPLAPGDADCVVAVIDSGVKTDHVDLDAHYAWGHDFYAGDADPTDVHGHGTHCVGIAAAETDNGVGVAGAANGCRFAAYRAGNASFPTSALVASIDDAVAQGAQVISMSWGSSYNNVLIRFALEDAHDAGCVLVAAAGNDNTSSKFYPAALSEVLGVASSSPSDTRSSFSNYGSWVSVAAPGQSIYSTSHTGGYVYKSGTSMACPLVAGMAALLYAQLGGERTAANAAAVRAALEDSAVDVGSWVEHGRVDLHAALLELSQASAPTLTSVSPTDVAAFGGERVTLTGSGLLGVSSVSLDDLPVDDLVVHDDGTLSFDTPSVPALGWHTLVAVKGGAVSNALLIEVRDTHPPRFTATPELDVGQTLELRMGGGSGDTWLLLASLTPDVVPFRGTTLLFPFKILTSNQLNAAGLAGLDLGTNPSVAGLSIHLQIATLDSGAFVGTSEVRHVQVGS